MAVINKLAAAPTIKVTSCESVKLLTTSVPLISIVWVPDGVEAVFKIFKTEVHDPLAGNEQVEGE